MRSSILIIVFLFFGTIPNSFAQSSFINAIDFDGSGDYANTLNDPFFPTTNGTLEAWVKVRSITAPIGNVFFEKNEEQWNQGDFIIFFETASGKLKARVQSSPSIPPMQTDVESDMNFWNSFDLWVHVAFTWGNNGMRLYINGNLQTSHNSITNPALNNTYNFYVGADGYMLHNGNYVVSNFFNGQIDEARVWNHQRTSDQIISLWEQPLDSSYFATLDSGLVGYWQFNELEDLGVNNDGFDDVRDFSVLQSHLDLAGDAHLVPANIVIPVELISFKAEFERDFINLSWITATELNNQGFNIERKTTSDWVKIGFVNGNGTTTENQYYSFMDDMELVNSVDRIYYRLKQIDFDGTYEYSNEVSVEFSQPDSYLLNQNYPNPFNPSTIISWQLPASNFVTLKIYDVLGNEVASLVKEEKPAGKFEVEFSATDLSSGIYYYKLAAGDFVDVKKLILLK